MVTSVTFRLPFVASFGRPPAKESNAPEGREIVKKAASLAACNSGFISRVAECNAGMERRNEFVSFLSGSKPVGYVHKTFVPDLLEFKDTFDVTEADGTITSLSVASDLNTVAVRTAAIAKALQSLRRKGILKRWRDELFPVATSFNSEPSFLMERAAVPYFGVVAYGVHVNGYVVKDRNIHLWVATRSQSKSTFPGKLDHIVAGGLPHSISCFDNVIKECEEEADIPRELASQAIPVGFVSYNTIEGNSFKRDVLFCYDLKLPLDFVPRANDGEVESFALHPIEKVAEIVSSSADYKSNCNLVIIDFLIRHGYIGPDDEGYLSLVKSLRQGDHF